MSFFVCNGVELITERGNRVFPKSGLASDISGVLTKTAREAGCRLRQARVHSIMSSGGCVTGVTLEDSATVGARAVILATGGLSYPSTGSTGDGYSMAQRLGHTLNATYPSLVALVCEGDICNQLEGLTLRNVALTLLREQRMLYRGQGEMLFTEDGVSGPLVLSASTQIMGNCSNLILNIDLKPALDLQLLDRRIQRDLSEAPARQFKNSLGALLPKKLIPVVVSLSGIEPDRRAGNVTAIERRQLALLLKEFTFKVLSTRPVEEAVVTGGGISLDEVNPRTMESRLIRNLHFAGEILDADGPTGGYNLGIAFATGYAAGSYVLEDQQL